MQDIELDNVVGIENVQLSPFDILSGKECDVLPKIFKFLISLKGKVRIERVCRNFKKYAPTLEAWSNISTIFIKDNPANDNFLINSDNIPPDNIAKVVETIISRNRNVTEFDLMECKRSLALRSLNSTVFRHGSVTLKNMKKLSFAGVPTDGYFYHTIALIDAFKYQLEFLQLSQMYFPDASATILFWSTVGECVNLIEFNFTATVRLHTDVCAWSSLGMIKIALRSKPIQSLRLLSLRISASDLVEIISSFTSDISIRNLIIAQNIAFSAKNFVQQFPAKYWRNLHTFTFLHDTALSSSDPSWSVFLRLPILCPELFHLVLIAFDENSQFANLNPSMAVALVDSYLNLLDEEDTKIRGTRLPLRLKSNAESRKIILGSLVAEHRFSCDPDSSFAFSCAVRRGSLTGITLELLD